MPVHQYGGQGWINDFFSVHNRISRCRANLNGIGSSLCKPIGHKRRTSMNVFCKRRVGTDGRNAQQIKQFGHKPFPLCLDKVLCFLHGYCCFYGVNVFQSWEYLVKIQQENLPFKPPKIQAESTESVALLEIKRSDGL
jgi:hypothetical protein